MSVGKGRLRPPLSGFTSFFLTREPLEDTATIILPEQENSSYVVTAIELETWLIDVYNHKEVAARVMDHLWNFYHLECDRRSSTVNTMPVAAIGMHNSQEHGDLFKAFDKVNR